MLASINYWRGLGLTWAEAGQRAAATHGVTDPIAVAGHLTLAQQVASAGQSVQTAPSGLPVFPAQLPTVSGQQANYEYATEVVQRNPDTDQLEHVTVIIRSNDPLGYDEISRRARESAARYVDKYPELQEALGISPGEVGALTLAEVNVVSASKGGTWNVQGYQGFR